MEGNIGVFAADKAGGTVGGIWPTLTARGAHWIAPVSLERLIPSVVEAAKHCGNHLWDYTMGQAAGFMPVVNATVVTEIQALEILTGVTAVHVGSGGVAGSEGAVILALEGEKEIEKGEVFEETYFNTRIVIEGREKKRVQLMLDSINSKEKTLVFCANIAHAGMVRAVSYTHLTLPTNREV